jgi:hypothetical protein
MDVRYTEASLKTADNLKTIAQSLLLRDLSRLSLRRLKPPVKILR